MARSQHVGPDARQKEFVRLVRANTGQRRVHEVFSDFCELAALSISNAVDRLQFAAREARYLEIVKRYTTEEVGRFPAMLCELVEMLEAGFDDYLGQLFMLLELGDHWKGQFFTPYSVASLMARMTLGDVRDQVASQGFITINEPACGAGAMVIGCAHAVLDQGINYQQVLHVTAQDIDATAAHMTYLQLALLHVPAIVVHGNSLAMTEWAHWVTPAHVLGGWDRRLRMQDLQRRAADASSGTHEVPAVAPRPAPEQTQDGELRAHIVKQRVEQLALFG